MSTAETKRIPALSGAGGMRREASPEKAKAAVPFAYQFPLRILIAEDDYTTRRVMIMFLKHYGYDVTSVENGRECLEEALRNPYDLIITDLDMPVMTGIECAEQLRHEGLDIPIVALSASAAPDPRGDCLRAGMDEYMAKPVSPDRLRTILRDAFFGQLRKKRGA